MNEMKESNVEWIGRIPLHWNILRLKYNFDVVCGATPKSDKPAYWEGDINWITPSDLGEQVTSISARRITEEGLSSCATTLSPPGSIIMSTRAPIGKLSIAGTVMCTSQGCKTLVERQNRQQYGKFLYYFLSTQIETLNMLGKGTTFMELSTSDIENFCIPNMGIKEIDTIVENLDVACYAIDSSIKNIQRQNELLEEYRKSIIVEAVTKGLNPNIPMKDSGVEWIGQIPQTWNLLRLKLVCSIKTGDKDTIDRDDNGAYPFFVRSPIVEKINSYAFDGEAILTAGDGVGAGRVFHHYIGKFDYHQRVYNLHNFKHVTGRYLYYYLRENFFREIERGSAKSTVDSIRLPMLMNYPVCIPDNCYIITDYLDNICENIGNISRKNIEIINHLEEYKKALIFEYVTGKKQVKVQP